jgi:hypothetical protein
MKEQILSTLLIAFLFCSCGVKDTSEIKVEVPKIDSTKYYDSLFKEARFTIDTFFQKRLESQEFNGNVLFAYKGHVILEKSYGFTNPTDSIEKRSSISNCFDHKNFYINRNFTIDGAR